MPETSFLSLFSGVGKYSIPITRSLRKRLGPVARGVFLKPAHHASPTGSLRSAQGRGPSSAVEKELNRDVQGVLKNSKEMGKNGKKLSEKS